MKNILTIIALILSAAAGCAPTVLVQDEFAEPEPNPCFTCSQAIVGSTLDTTNACDGSLELWQSYKIGTCAEESICKVYCAASLCSGKAPSPDCRACAIFGTTSNPFKQDHNFITCKSDQ